MTQCQSPHLAGDPTYAESWRLLNCRNRAKGLVTIHVSASEGATFRERVLVVRDITIAICGVCFGALPDGLGIDELGSYE